MDLYTHCYAYSSRWGRIAVLASGAMLFLGGTGFAQTVQMFEDAPSVEQLRGIMVPESKAGASRTIVIQRPGQTGYQSAVQPASTAPAAPAQAAAPAAPVAAPSVVAASSVAAVDHEPKATQPAAEPAAVAFRINFAFNSAVLPENAHVMIDRIAQLMKEEPQVKLRIEGHTDAVGSENYNVSLSEQRAESVGQYLVTLGIEPARLTLVGKGKAEPLTRDPYDAANRRVQFVRTG